MARRKGLGKGKGKGYKNVLGNDSHIHRQSAKGIKQPQRINENMMVDRFAEANEPKFLEKTLSGLDSFERRVFKELYKRNTSIKKSLEILINSVEGDVSQLSPALLRYAVKEKLI